MGQWRHLIGTLGLTVVMLLTSVGLQPTPARASPSPGNAEVKNPQGAAYACPYSQPAGPGCTVKAKDGDFIHDGGEARTEIGTEDVLAVATLPIVGMQTARFQLGNNARLQLNFASDSQIRSNLLGNRARIWVTGGTQTVTAGPIVMDTADDVGQGGGGSRPIQTNMRSAGPGTPAYKLFTAEVRNTEQGIFVYAAVPQGGGSVVLRLNGGNGPVMQLAEGYEITIPPGAQQFPPVAPISAAEAQGWSETIDGWRDAMGLPPKPAAPAANPPAELPTDTRYAIPDKFLAYWQAHGGLAQFGNPIGPAFTETSALDKGKQYTQQYFERALFELHPENAGTPYEVLLAQLGTYRYQQRYGKSGAPGQSAATQNPRVFAETGKTIGGRFREYWEQHGGLTQFGYPLSNEFMEKSDLDSGKSYRVQYFERAVFEYHPENPAGHFDVLLAQLGTYSMNAK